jgi:ferrous-iron efflux pump FieF
MAVIVALLLDQYAGGRGPTRCSALALRCGWHGAHGTHRRSHRAIDGPRMARRQKGPLRRSPGRHPELRGVHDLRTRTSGNRDFVQFHVWVDGSMTVTQAHRVMDEIEDKLHAEFPDVEILIHPDPEGHVDERGVAGRDICRMFKG